MRSALEEALSVLTEVMDPFLQEPHLSPHCAPLMGQRWPRRQPASPGSIFPCSLGGWSWAPACPLWSFSLAHLEVGAGHQRVLCGSSSLAHLEVGAGHQRVLCSPFPLLTWRLELGTSVSSVVLFPCSLGGWSWAPACPLWSFSLAHLEVGAGHQRVLCGPLLHTVSPPCEMKILLPALPALEAFPVPGIFTRGSPWGPTPACVLGRCASSRASRDPCPEVQASGLWLSAPQVGPE